MKLIFNMLNNKLNFWLLALSFWLLVNTNKKFYIKLNKKND